MNLLELGVLFEKSVSSFKPDYRVDYLEDSPWIHMPFEIYEDMNIEDLKKTRKNLKFHLIFFSF